MFPLPIAFIFSINSSWNLCESGVDKHQSRQEQRFIRFEGSKARHSGPDSTSTTTNLGEIAGYTYVSPEGEIFTSSPGLARFVQVLPNGLGLFDDGPAPLSSPWLLPTVKNRDYSERLSTALIAAFYGAEGLLPILPKGSIVRRYKQLPTGDQRTQ